MIIFNLNKNIIENCNINRKKKKGGKPNTGKESILGKPAVPNTATHKPKEEKKEVPKVAEKGASGQHNNNRPETRAEEEVEK